MQPHQRVLELGCGTGQVTAELVAAGAHVVAVDALPAMLEGARRRDPSATYVHGDVIEAEVGAGYDRVVLSFVLHNFDAEGRVRLLRRAASALTEGGRIGILDWALPPGPVCAAAWRWFLGRLEPAPTVKQFLDGALDAHISTAGLSIHACRSAAARRCQIVDARRTHARRVPG